MLHGLDGAELVLRQIEPELVQRPLRVDLRRLGAEHSGDLPGWRTFITAKLESVDPREEIFTPRSDCERMAEGMVEIFART